MRRKKRKKNIFGKIFSFKIMLLISMVIVIFLSISVGGEYYRKHQIQKEISSLKKEIDYFETNNYKLSQLVDYYETDEYKELEARKRLNMKKEGESVAIINQSRNKESDVVSNPLYENINMANYVRWWNYFFRVN